MPNRNIAAVIQIIFSRLLKYNLFNSIMSSFMLVIPFLQVQFLFDCIKSASDISSDCKAFLLISLPASLNLSFCPLDTFSNIVKFISSAFNSLPDQFRFFQDRFQSPRPLIPKEKLAINKLYEKQDQKQK